MPRPVDALGGKFCVTDGDKGQPVSRPVGASFGRGWRWVVTLVHLVRFFALQTVQLDNQWRGPLVQWV